MEIPRFFVAVRSINMDLNQHRFTQEVLSEQESLISSLTSEALLRASESLQQLVPQQFEFSAPEAVPVTINDISARFGVDDADLVQVSQRCDNYDDTSISRLRLLMLNSTATRLIRKLLREPNRAVEMTELEQEALTETGNILLNACLVSYMERFSIAGCPQLPQLTFRKFNMLFFARSPALIDSISTAFSINFVIKSVCFEMVLLIEAGTNAEDITLI